ncbi:MAG: hypothetical protein OXH41_07995 [Chloroflexi bacterium]|nr:hypothetical protein [Chloroflexota bacterium]
MAASPFWATWRTSTSPHNPVGSAVGVDESVDVALGVPVELDAAGTPAETIGN